MNEPKLVWYCGSNMILFITYKIIVMSLNSKIIYSINIQETIISTHFACTQELYVDRKIITETRYFNKKKRFLYSLCFVYQVNLVFHFSNK